MYMPSDITKLVKVYIYLRENNYKYFIIGNGTNLLINDRYFDMIFINLKNINKIIDLNDDYIYIDAGINNSKLLNYSVRNNKKGIEFLSGIPGTIGGAIYMNAGAHKKEIKDVVNIVFSLDDVGDIKIYRNSECNFSYRNSVFKKNKELILGMIIKLTKGNNEDEVKELIKKYYLSKKRIQPLNKKTAGSTFKNLESYKAYEVINILGYNKKHNSKRFISPMHSNFIINENDATFNDIYSLIKTIQNDSYEKLNINLETEIEIIE